MNKKKNCSSSPQTLNPCLKSTYPKAGGMCNSDICCFGDGACQFIPWQDFKDPLLKIFKSNWRSISFYLTKSGVGLFIAGLLTINHAAIIAEVEDENSNFSYYLIAEVEPGNRDWNAQLSLTKILCNVLFPKVNSDKLEWNSMALIQAGKICVKSDFVNLLMSRQDRINKIATLCGWGGLLEGGSGFPHILLHLKKNNHHIHKKLKKFVSFIEKLDDPKYRPYYKFFGVKTSVPNPHDGKCIVAHPYTCETFASLLVTFIHREFKHEINNDPEVYATFVTWLGAQGCSTCKDNLPPQSGELARLSLGKFKNEQAYLHLPMAGFRDVNGTIHKFTGKKWKHMSEQEKNDCKQFCTQPSNVIKSICNPEPGTEGGACEKNSTCDGNLKCDIKTNTCSSGSGILGLIITDLYDFFKKSVSKNIWISAYPDLGGKSEPLWYSFPKWDQLDWLDTSYTLTLSAFIDQSDYLPMTNPQLLDEIDPKKHKKNMCIIIFAVVLLLIFIIILFMILSKSSQN